MYDKNLGRYSHKNKTFKKRNMRKYKETMVISIDHLHPKGILTIKTLAFHVVFVLIFHDMFFNLN